MIHARLIDRIVNQYGFSTELAAKIVQRCIDDNQINELQALLDIHDADAHMFEREEIICIT